MQSNWSRIAGPVNVEPDVEPLALIDRTVELLAVEPHAPYLAPRIRQRRAGALEFRHFDRRYQADAAHAIGDDLDRFLRRRVAEHGLVLPVEGHPQLFKSAAVSGTAGQGTAIS